MVCIVSTGTGSDTVEGDVLLQVPDRRRVGADPGRVIERLQVLAEAQPGGLVQRLDLAEVGRLAQVGEVVDAGIPGRVAAGPALELGPQQEREREVDLALPLELVGFLGGEVVRGRLGDSGVNQPGVSPSAAVSASLACPCGVAWAAAAAFSAPVRF